MYGGASTFLPLKVDQRRHRGHLRGLADERALYHRLFSTRAPWAQKLMSLMNHTSILYQLVYVALIIFFCYFYNSVSINPKDLAENMKKWAASSPACAGRADG